MPSTLSFNQCATLLNAINQQATGRYHANYDRRFHFHGYHSVEYRL